VELALGSDRCHVLEDPWADHAIPVRFEHPAESFGGIGARGPFDGIVAVGDGPALAAAFIAQHLGLRFSPPAAVAAAMNKFLARLKFREAKLLVPEFELLDCDDPHPESRNYPCVLKPVSLSASRGVIRVDNAEEFGRALRRIQKIVENESNQQIQVE